MHADRHRGRAPPGKRGSWRTSKTVRRIGAKLFAQPGGKALGDRGCGHDGFPPVKMARRRPLRAWALKLRRPTRLGAGSSAARAARTRFRRPGRLQPRRHRPALFKPMQHVLQRAKSISAWPPSVSTSETKVPRFLHGLAQVDFDPFPGGQREVAVVHRVETSRLPR